MGINKQPWYHEVSILFTATRPIWTVLTKKEEDLIKAIIEKKRGVVKGTVEVMYTPSEPGDPADLM